MMRWDNKERTFKHQWSIRANEEGTSTSATDRASTPFSIDSNVAGEDDSIPPVPRGAFYPINGVE